MTQAVAHITTATPQLGQATNLLEGFDLLPENSVVLSVPPKAPLRQFPVEVAASGQGSWQPICVSLHRDIDSVMERIIPFQVQSLLAEEPGFRLEPLHLFNMAPLQQRSWTAAFLGIQPEDGCHYMLLELNRTDESARHEIAVNPTRRSFDRNWYLTDSWRIASTKLRPGKRIHEEFEQDAVISTEKAKEYLAAFYTYGTHVVSALELGDKLFQVVKLKAEMSGMVVDFWRQLGNGQPVSGADAQAFGLFLGPGYAAEVGPIRSLANDPALSASIRKEAWIDPRSLTGHSLLAASTTGADVQERVLAGFSAVMATKITFVSQARFLGFYRARNFERILRGALIQRWETLVELPIRRMPGIQNSLKIDVLSDAFSARGNGGVSLYGEQLRPADRDYLGDGQTCTLVCHRKIGFRDGFREMDLRNTILLAQIIDAGPTSGQASRLTVPDADFRQAVLVCQKMAGVLIIENEAGTKKDVVLDGLRFTREMPESPLLKPRISICGDLHTLDQNQLNLLLPVVQNTLACIAVALNNPDTDNEQRAEAASFAEWLASLLVSGSQATARQLRIEALYLARIASISFDRSVRLTSAATAAMCAPYREIAKAAMSFAETSMGYDGWETVTSQVSMMPAARGTWYSEKLLRYAQQISENHRSVLEKTRQACAQVAQEAFEGFQKSRTSLAEKFDDMGTIPDTVHQGGAQILAAMAAGAKLESSGTHAENSMRQDASEIQGIIMEFFSVEGCTLRQFSQLQALEALCALLKTNIAPPIDDLEKALECLAQYPDQHWQPVTANTIDLKRAMYVAVASGAIEKKWINELLLIWTQFETSRHKLLTDRLHLCLVQLECWALSIHQDNIVPEASCGTVATNDDDLQRQLQLKRLSIFSMLGQALRQQALALTAIGLEKQGAPAYFEAAAVGYFLQLQSERIAGHLEKTSLTHASTLVYG